MWINGDIVDYNYNASHLFAGQIKTIVLNRSAGSVANTSQKYGQHGLEYQPEVAENRSGVRVLQIQSHPIRERNLSRLGYLPTASESRLGIQSTSLPYFAFGIFAAW